MFYKKSYFEEHFYGKDIYVYENVSGKQLCGSLFLIKYQAVGLQPYLKKRLQRNFFSK